MATEVRHCAFGKQPDPSFEHARKSSNKIQRSGTGFLGALADKMVGLSLVFSGS